MEEKLKELRIYIDKKIKIIDILNQLDEYVEPQIVHTFYEQMSILDKYINEIINELNEYF